jgi:hypothetical protein
MSTQPLTTVTEFIDDMFSHGDVETIPMSIGGNPMLHYTVNYNGHTISTIVNEDDFHSIVVKRKNNDTYDAYVFYDKNATITDLYKEYNDILDVENYTEGNLCIHDQSDNFQIDYMNDIIERAYILYRNETFPDTVPVFFDIDDDLYEYVIEMASERGVTIDQLINEIVIAEIEKLTEKESALT